MDLILPDVNVLVYAFQVDARDHPAYRSWLNAARHSARIGLPEAVLLGFIRVMTDPRIYAQRVTAREALAFIASLRATPRATAIGPTTSTWTCLQQLIERDPRVRGKLIPDAWLAALAISHGARLATADRDFARYDGLDWFDPVAG